MTCTLEIPNETGHLTLKWDPADEKSVVEAKAEFDRLKACGYAFYATDGREVRRPFSKKTKLTESSLEIRIIKEFEPKAPKTVAMRPMAGG